MNFKELKNLLTQATKQAFIKIFKENNTEDLYAFALCINDSIISINCSANSIEYLNNVSDENDFNYYKYEPSEWIFQESFHEINSICRAIADEHDDDEDWFYQFQNQLNNLCIDVLQDLKNDHFFMNEVGENIFLNFSIIDDDLSNEKQIEIITKLNDNQYKNDYFDWMKSMENKKRAL